MMSALIEVYQSKGEFGVIIRDPLGPIWTSQTGGMCCNHPRCAGYYVPIPAYSMTVKKLHGYICGGPGYTATKELADVDTLLRTAGLRIDTSAYAQTEEGWIPVVVDHGFSQGHPLHDMVGRRGVLVYENCD